VKILLDNCLDVRVKSLLAGHAVEHVLDRGWDTLSNGKLIAAAVDAGFEVFVTADKGLRFQQNLARLTLTILELDVAKNRLDVLEGMREFINAALGSAPRYRFVSVRQDGAIEVLHERIPPA